MLALSFVFQLVLASLFFGIYGSPIPDTTETTSNVTLQGQPTSRALYFIAHRVLTRNGVRAALSHGANAIEVDLTAWRNGWWADHDGNIFSRADRAEAVFNEIATQRKNGAGVTFVWLDIKNPNYAETGISSVSYLRELARKHLEPVGVRVLFGFSKVSTGRTKKAFDIVRDGLNKNEAMCIWDQSAKTLAFYKQEAKNIPTRQKMLDNGFFHLGFRPSVFGDLRKASESRDRGEVAKIFGWNISFGQRRYAERLLGESRVDGLIYGYTAWNYNNSRFTRAMIGYLTGWLKEHSKTHHLATKDEFPW
ncbi:hypothetical protein LOZ12_002051 [Ophidiomyces ophidiicola]|uniref:Uncharacterized protein n=1 Tax=Ophidiomyces ophidiicola TaxID=1387563 RepID=A0ACB8UZD6_9EURO|nr:uncharacterized protein LOZ57_001594 [Ophidiomyces ophidiicola]KAI1910260.1 hypothetical protein LOZ61_004506 [Ophidiomyces ophidiicola]KAI1919039.1 hypothetical protein LOZ64_002410 [Ophidiomyces ophidiicola]KAI1924952.1 hypothetical protein LOZ60_004395 [Ophidiomyces ophidiicola]KAI1951044.1 hypothetical protein LOZ57_001594 [Ophidiomyces ophidiicola]KAI1952159.1 hypothetical protein LOZ62_001471 [Ophidiomyces ophidiicola]